MTKHDQLVTSTMKDLVDLNNNLGQVKVVETYQKLEKLPIRDLKKIQKAISVLREEIG